MAGFKFRLVSVLRFRERLQEEKQWELHSLLVAREKMTTEIAALERERTQLEEKWATREGQIFTPLEIRFQANYARALWIRIDERRVALAELDQKVSTKREELVEAMRAVKTLQQLRERLEEKYLHKQALDEQKNDDEIGQRKFYFRKRQKFP